MTAWRNRALWAGVAILCYLVGAIVFLSVIVGSGIFGSGSGLGSLTAGEYAALLASGGLFAVGGYAMHRVQRSTGPEESPLPSQFQRGPGPSRPNPDAAPDVTGGSTGDDAVRCRNCGTENDAGFTFCENCSSELPE